MTMTMRFLKVYLVAFLGIAALILSSVGVGALAYVILGAVGVPPEDACALGTAFGVINSTALVLALVAWAHNSVC